MRQNNGLVIRLAERWFKIDKRLSGYRDRPPIIEQLCLTRSDGSPLPFELESYPHLINFHTDLGKFTLTFEDSETLMLVVPEAACGISFIVHVDQGQPDRRGGILRKTGDIRRNIAYTTNRHILENKVTPTQEEFIQVHLTIDSGERGVILLNITPRLGFNRYIPSIDETIKKTGDLWESWFQSTPQVDPAFRLQYYFAWWVMRCGLISSRFYTTREAMTPSKIHYVGVWQWDAYFHALAYRYNDHHLAHDQIRVVLDHQRQDGMIPDAVHDEGTITHLTFPIDADVTKPPLLAWTAWKLFQYDKDREFIDEIYEPVERWNNWWFDHNDVTGDGLCEYLHPYSSGLDDSPLWDEGMPVTSPDLNTYLYLQMENLKNMAEILNMPGEAVKWQKRADNLLDRMVERLWDADAGVFWAYRQDDPIKILTPFNLLPLLTGKLDRAISDKLVANLLNPKTFWTRFPIPTVAINQSCFNPTQMWRGPTWVNVNYLIIEGLERSGYIEIANDLRQRTLDLLDYQADIFEYYNPLTGEPCTHAATTFGWSAALLIELMIQASKKA